MWKILREERRLRIFEKSVLGGNGPKRDEVTGEWRKLHNEPVWCMGKAGWIPKATNTHPEYVIFISLPLQKWLQKFFSFLLYTYIGCLYLLGVYVGISTLSITRKMCVCMCVCVCVCVCNVLTTVTSLSLHRALRRVTQSTYQLMH